MMSEAERSKEKEGGTSMSSVHSANKWESASFGDDAQRQKFLRLMGGMKKEHTGRFVIGETDQKAHTRSDDENKELSQTLEHQYEVGLEKKLTGQNRRHVGLGFAEPEEEIEKQPAGTHIHFDDGHEEEKSTEDHKDEPSDRRDKDGKDEGDRTRRDERDRTRRDERDRKRRDERGRDSNREGKDDKKKRDEKRRERRDDGSRRRSSERDAESGSRERHRDEDRGKRSRDDNGTRRDHKDKDKGQVEPRGDDKSESPKMDEASKIVDKKHKQGEESDETHEQKRKKHKHKKSQQEDGGSDSE